MENKICGIYKIENLVNKKIYVGQSNDIEKRWRRHKFYANHRCVDNDLYNDMNEIGFNNFKFEVLEECTEDEKLLNEKEIYWINKLDTLNNGYNTDKGGGVSRTKEKHNKLSLVSKKLWQDPEYRKKQSKLQSIRGVKGGAIGGKLNKGTRLINNGEITKRVHPEQLNEYLSNGWELGFLKKII